MKNLNELVGQKVVALIEEDEINHYVDCEVLSIFIDDFYYQEKGECISIYVNLIPVDSYEEVRKRGLESDDFNGVPLENITKY